MKEEIANKVYDILVNIGAASESMRDSFVHNHTRVDDECREWRFGGRLGFGGKYRSITNTVDCYSEDLTDDVQSIINKINLELSKLI